MQDLCESPTCPRCGVVLAEPITRNAVSRVDNMTRICSSCGVSEAYFEMVDRRSPLPPLDREVYA